MIKFTDVKDIPFLSQKSLMKEQENLEKVSVKGSQNEPLVKGWIAVKDELPKLDTDVLCYYKPFKDSVGRIEVLRLGDNNWWSCRYEVNDVKYWMPLPSEPTA